MAYMSMERKQKLAPGIKAVLKKYGMKGTISKDRFSIKVNITSGPIDFIKPYNESGKAEWAYKYPSWKWVDQTYIDVNTYWIDQNYENNPQGKAFLLELYKAMSVGNHDNSDIQTDYFDVGWYTHINIGKWNKPYVFDQEAQKEAA
jgi:hypothetical protein